MILTTLTYQTPPSGSACICLQMVQLSRGRKCLWSEFMPKTSISSHSHYLSFFISNASNAARGIEYLPSWAGRPFDIIPALRIENATISVNAIAKGPSVKYGHPVEDPLFSAHQEIVLQDIRLGKNATYYTSDELMSVLGCKLQVSNFSPKDLLTRFLILTMNSFNSV